MGLGAAALPPGVARALDLPANSPMQESARQIQRGTLRARDLVRSGQIDRGGERAGGRRLGLGVLRGEHAALNAVLHQEVRTPVAHEQDVGREVGVAGADLLEEPRVHARLRRLQPFQ